MRKLSAAATALILAIAFYFTLFWGYDALRMLTSPTYGLEDVWRSQFVFEIGRIFVLSPIGLIKLAAFFATMKLAVAIICAAHIVERALGLFGTKTDTEILEVGMLLVVAISIVSVVPAIWSHNAVLVREQVIQLVLAAIAGGLGLVERRDEPETATVALSDIQSTRNTVTDVITSRFLIKL